MFNISSCLDIYNILTILNIYRFLYNYIINYKRRSESFIEYNAR